ncbi:tRNA (adenosine(37)-N6)-threonylcarbamoyltransferase complex ATPase subunit type 1 TsaE [Rhizobium sp. KVB221]|uniref:tRNA threonylcarbamoyladenosine biosynthesis protein TsaE n=1 Tax=Rhizobium setariae TaxID=2801340 RepID=A0A937CMD0_9HYPH|nr:tRNA (adenosine(37)-N6)-threonylcarbamoyltransferase complex ATPase subunit type 1 TsaE [Rhizobium setariae]MBL0374180.1 tRNA (adenosine(37)-N6)-threonylcarbamoyltransferase complex ATPase subunit type 1 TsaE [Rhizobium setariae]
MKHFSFFLPDDDATRALGEDLALTVRPGDCLALSGDLGAGKSALSRAMIRAIANDDVLEVPSPTFTLVQSYELRIPVSHFDLYRLGDESELAELGLEEVLQHGVALIEWPDRAGCLLPKDAIRIAIAHEGSGRRVEIESSIPRFSDRLTRVRSMRDFLDSRGYAGAQRRFLIGDSSFRAYERIRTADGKPFVLMDSPARSNGPPIRDGKPYSQLVHLAENVQPFIAVGKYLRDMQLSAPAIYETDIDQGILLIEDLGSEGVLDANGKPIAERYEESIRCLADFHRHDAPARLPITADTFHTIPHFDRDTLKFEAEVLLDWHLPWRRNGEQASEAEKRDYLEIWDHLIDELQSAEKNLVLRDYHSPNIMWMAERQGFNRVGIIDFQDAIIGPSAYDVVSITRDARVTVERPLMERLVDIYVAAREAAGEFDREGFFKSYAIMTAQRSCRLNGLWVRLWQRDHMQSYMKHMPRTLWHLGMAFEHSATAPLREWCKKAGIAVAESPEV